jgi:hypothetical protein
MITKAEAKEKLQDILEDFLNNQESDHETWKDWKDELIGWLECDQSK